MASNRPLVGIVGGLNSGKGVVCSAFEKQGFTVHNFADPLKVILQNLFDIPDHVVWGPSENRTPEFRRMMQEFGTDFARRYNPDIWIDKMQKIIRDFRESSVAAHTGFLVGDVRFLNEAHALHNMGARLVKVYRPNNAAHAPPAAQTHQSEVEHTAIPDSLITYHIANDSSLEALNTAAAFIAREVCV